MRKRGGGSGQLVHKNKKKIDDNVYQIDINVNIQSVFKNKMYIVL